MTDASQIERVARALFQADNEMPLSKETIDYWFEYPNKGDEWTGNEYRKQARAAIAAMQPPPATWDYPPDTLGMGDYADMMMGQGK